VLGFAAAGQCGREDVEAFQDLDLGFLVVAGAFEQFSRTAQVLKTTTSAWSSLLA
jgi:hypothetical protein